MIHCKKTIIAACFSLMLPLVAWSEAPVVDDSDNFALFDGQQEAQAPVVHPGNHSSQFENAKSDRARNSRYQDQESDDQFEGPALVHDEQGTESANDMNDNAKLIDKIQILQQEVQELRGQLEVQAHDLKLLQQQQASFYKDIDSRLGATNSKAAQTKPPIDINIGSKTPTVQAIAPKVSVPKEVKSAPTPRPVSSVSRINPADEQISYLAAYELVKNKRYDDAINAMQTFSQKYPKGGYTANAEYWLGELFLVKKDYLKAIEHFEVVLKEFPSSSKSAASMLKVGYAYAATGDKQEATRYFQQVMRTYPDTATAQLASSKLETINAL